MKKKVLNNTDIYLVDTYGETKSFFKISKIVFIGGSMIEHGGQNPLEAARFGLKILHGKHIGNFYEIYSLLKKNGQSQKINTKKHFIQLVLNSILNGKKKNLLSKKLKKINLQILNKTEKEINTFIDK